MLLNQIMTLQTGQVAKFPAGNTHCAKVTTWQQEQGEVVASAFAVHLDCPRQTPNLRLSHFAPGTRGPEYSKQRYQICETIAGRDAQ